MSYVTAISGTMPSRTDSQEDFSDKADALVAALPAFQTQINTVVDETNASVNAVEADRVAVVALKADVTTLKSDCQEIKGLCETAQGLAENARDASEDYRDSAQTAAAAAQSAAGLPSFTSHSALSTLRINASKTGVEWGVTATPLWRGIYYTSSSATWTVPDGVSCIRIYAGGKGGNSGPTVSVSETTSVTNRYAKAQVGGGGGGGLAWGTLDVVPGDVIAIVVSSGIVTVSKSGTTLMSANPGTDGTSSASIATGSAPSLVVSNGDPGIAQVLSSLVYDSGVCSGSSFGGAGNPTGTPIVTGQGLSSTVRSILTRFSDPLLLDANGPSGTYKVIGTDYVLIPPLSGGAGYSINAASNTASLVGSLLAGNGADFGSGGSATSNSSNISGGTHVSASSQGGTGGLLGPGGEASAYSSTVGASYNATSTATPGAGGICGGGSSSTAQASSNPSGPVISATANTALGGSAIAIIMY